MILYFSGTGNSLYIAKKLLSEGERLVSVADVMKQKESVLELSDGEKLGIIFPVYFYTLPKIVEECLKAVEIRNASYVYSVITCGGGTGQASAVLNKLLREKGIALSYFKEVLMPDNSMLFYQIPGVDKANDRLEEATKACEEISRDISEEKIIDIKTCTLISDLMGVGYRMCSKTKKFYAQDTCVGCGLCERNCPEQVIRIEDGKPVWSKERCSKCSACINKCPMGAIQYGRGTIKRNRYSNPLLREPAKGNVAPGNMPQYDSSNVVSVANSPLKAKNVLFLGSSVTFGAASCQDGIPEYFRKRFECFITKEAVSGTTLVDKDFASYVSRLVNNVDPATRFDLVICQLSTNDATQGLPLGVVSESFDINVFDTMTILGAMEYIIAYCKENWDCPIAFYTGSRYESEPYEAMVGALYALAEKWGIGVLDLWTDEAFNSLSQEKRELYMSDPIHPTKAGYMKWWCPEMEKQILQYLAY